MMINSVGFREYAHDFLYLHPHFDLPSHIVETVILPLVWLLFFIAIYFAIKAIRNKTGKRRKHVRIVLFILFLILFVVLFFG